MCTLSSGQIAGQMVYPSLPAATVDNLFVPFLCSSTTIGVNYTGAKFPLPLVENIKSLTSRMIYHKGAKQDPEWFVGVLGQYQQDVLVSTDYGFSYLNGSAIAAVDSFVQVPAIKRRRRDSKKGDVWIPEVEAAINFIDGSSGSDYLFINDVNRLHSLAEMWNDWLSTLSQFSSPLIAVSYDLGVNIACSVSSTLYWNQPSGQEMVREKEFLDERLLAKKFVSTVYNSRVAVAMSSSGKLLSGPTEQIVSQWILPVLQIQGGTPPSGEMTFGIAQDLLCEPFSLPFTSTGDNGMTMGSRHVSYANKMVHGISAPSSDWDQFFIEETKLGAGGILSSLAADLLGKAFGPTAGAIAGSVASMLPI